MDSTGFFSPFTQQKSLAAFLSYQDSYPNFDRGAPHAQLID